MKNISKENLANIINTTIQGYGEASAVKSYEQMSEFHKDFFYKVQTDPQLNLFDAEFPTSEDVKNAKKFCKIFVDYKRYVDICVDNEDAYFSEDSYRELYQYLQLNKKHISKENINRFNDLEKTLRRYIPEFSKTEKICQFNEDALNVINMKKEYKKTKNPRLSDYSKYADLLFKELSENQDILKIEPDELKLSLYENCVKVVDCLSEKYNRTTKFEYKERLYDAIAKTATLLNNKEKANQANHEKTKFTNARENALYHVSDYHKAKNDRKFQKRNDWENS